MRTFAILPLVLLAGTFTVGCSIETDTGTLLTRATRHGPESLAVAVRSRDLVGIEAALAAGVDPNLPGPSHLPPLHLAAALGYIEEARLLIKHGADIDKFCVVPTQGPDGKEVWQPISTPLHLAAQQGDVDFVLMLLEQDVDVNIQNAREATPLDMAQILVEQLQRRTDRLTASLAMEQDPSQGRVEPLQDMLAKTDRRLRDTESVTRVLLHHGAKTRLDIEAARLMAELDADGKPRDVAGRLRQWREGHKLLGRTVSSDTAVPEAALGGVEQSPAANENGEASEPSTDAP